MSELISAFLILKDEEELLAHCLESFAAIADLLDVVSVVDNGSCDASLDILTSFYGRLPIVMQREIGHAHHGHLRNMALAQCRAPWVLYLDADETFTSNMRDWLLSGVLEEMDVWDFFKFSTIVDRHHYVEGGNGPSTRLFRNLPGVYFPQEIHTYPTHPGLQRKRQADGVFMFDHTAIKSNEARWAKGFRYLWGNRLGIQGVGNETEYIWRVEEAFRAGTTREFDGRMKELIFCGP